MHLLIAYDIVSTKRRNKVASELEKTAVRINKSVFLWLDAGLTPEQMAEKLKPFTTPADSVYVVALCKSCIEKSIYLQAKGQTFRQRRIKIV